MRVLHVAETLPGGIASYFSELVIPQSKALGADNVKFLLPEEQLHHVAGIKARQTIPYQRGGRNPMALLRLAEALRITIRDFKPDVIHLHSSFAGAVGRVVAFLCSRNVKIIYCAHGWVFNMDHQGSAKSVFKLVELLLARVTDKIVNISEDEFNTARVAGIKAEKMVTIRNGISPLQSVPKAELPARTAKLELVYVGRFDHDKGTDILLNAMNQLQTEDIHLTLIGAPVKGDEDFRLPPDANITAVGWLQRHKLIPYLQGADAVIIPSRWEGFGLAAIEAMSLGTAVIASDRGALPEIIEHEKTGLIFSLTEPESLVKTLTHTSATKLAKMGKAGRQKFIENYTAERFNAEILALYESLQHESKTA